MRCHAVVVGNAVVLTVVVGAVLLSFCYRFLQLLFIELLLMPLGRLGEIFSHWPLLIARCSS